GQWLRQETLAGEMGVSQMPVREALKRLVGEGLAVRIPYHGVKVVEFSAKDIVDICTSRLVLEGLAARFAASLISAEELGYLRRNLEEATQYTAQHQMSKRREMNDMFHLTISRASDRQYLARLIEALWSWFPSFMLYEGMYRQEAFLPARLEREMKEHWAILAALEKRDPDEAERATRNHIRNLSQELTELLDIPLDVVEPLGAI
ncbi:MAG TPA: GntR family transcriptional regulator, partial [Anaerolineae bacterium]|nr:GntR family transcriptional regulator [Anaerolineae bacterium]